MHRFPPFDPELSRRQLLRWLSASAAVGIVGCGKSPSDAGGDGDGDGDGNPLTLERGESAPGKGTPGTPVSATQQAQAFTQLETKLTELFDNVTGSAPADEVLGWLAEQNAFQRVGLSASGDVYAIFTNGHRLLVQTDLRMGTDGIEALSSAPPVTGGDSQTVPRRAPLPGDYDAGLPSKQFRFINTWYADGETFGPIDTWARNNEITPRDPGLMCMKMEEFGYQVVFGNAGQESSGISGDLESLKFNVSGDGVFYWGTHGGEIDLAGNVVQALMTSTTADAASIPDYIDEIVQGTLVYYTAPLCPLGCGSFLNPRGFRTRFAITPAWITKYNWSFGEHSLVFLNACLSGTSPWRQAFFDAGASVFIGWNKAVRFWAVCGSSLDFFSLMLGLNENFGGAGMSGSYFTPTQRPYDWGEVLFHLQAKTMMAGYDDPEEGIVMLEATANPNVPFLFLCLRPSMYWNIFDELTGEHHLIGGMFGKNQGTAAIGTSVECTVCPTFANWADFPLQGATPLSVKSWDSKEIVLNVPASGPGSVGVAQVTADGRWSNGAQLTRISFPLKATQVHGGTLTVEVNAQLHFRGDFRGVRLSPIQALTYLPSVPCYTPTIQGTFTATGSYTYNSGDDVIEVEWSGSGTVVPPSWGLLYGDIVPKDRKGRFTIRLEGSGIHEKVTVTPQDGDPYEYEQDIDFAMETPEGPSFPFDIHSFIVQFNAAYASAKVTQANTEPEASSYNSADLTTTFECGPFTSEYPPDDETGGR